MRILKMGKAGYTFTLSLTLSRTPKQYFYHGLWAGEGNAKQYLIRKTAFQALLSAIALVREREILSSVCIRNTALG